MCIAHEKNHLSKKEKLRSMMEKADILFLDKENIQKRSRN